MVCEYCGRDGVTAFRQQDGNGWKHFCDEKCWKAWFKFENCGYGIDEASGVIKPGDIITLARIKGVKGMKKRKNRTFVVTHVSR